MKRTLALLFALLSCAVALSACAYASDHAHVKKEPVRENEVELGCVTVFDEVIYCENGEELSRETKTDGAHNFVNKRCRICRAEQESEGLKFVSNKDGTCYLSGIGECTDTRVVIPYLSKKGDRVTAIGEGAFEDNIVISGIVIPDSVAKIGKRAFAGCTGLASVTFGEDSALTEISRNAFSECEKLSVITIPEAVTTIGDYAFSNCASLRTITVPSKVRSIGVGTFSYCKMLKTVNLGDNVFSIGEKAFYKCESLASFTIPENVTQIAESTFYKCISLREIEIPSRVQMIKEKAFFGCEALTSVTFAQNSRLQKIEAQAFSCCYALRSFDIPAYVTSVGDNAFAYCTSMTEITIPKRVTEIGNYAFRDCEMLTIYCEAKAAPATWANHWNIFCRPVVWDYKAN